MARTLEELESEFKRLALEDRVASLERKKRRRDRSSQWRVVNRPPNSVDAVEALESEYPEVVDPTLWASPEVGIAPYARRDQFGNYAPFIRSETELRLLQAQSRVLWTGNPWLAGLKDDLQNFAIGTGFVAQVTTKADAPQAIVDRVQKLVNDLLDLNEWPGDLDREFFFRSIEDGESNLRLHFQPDDWVTTFRIVEPEYICQPRDQTRLEQWIAENYDTVFPLGAPDSGPLYDWTYGIQTPRNDTQSTLGYFVLWAAGEDWDYVPAAEMVRLKRNTWRSIKPGLPDAYSIGPIAGKAMRLLRSMLSGAHKQARLALITTYESQLSEPGGQAALNDMLSATSSRMKQARGATDFQADNRDDAFNYHAPAGRSVQAGPLANTNAANFELILQAGLRCIGKRWSAPEYLISGDASNGNFASTMVAESPFVKNMQAAQFRHARKLKEIIWKAMRHAHAVGYFKGLEGATKDFDEFRLMVDLDADAPPIETRDKESETRRRQILYREGVVNQETFAAEEGYDLAEEKAKSGNMLDPHTGAAVAPLDVAGLLTGDPATDPTVDPNQPDNPDAAADQPADPANNSNANSQPPQNTGGRTPAAQGQPAASNAGGSADSPAPPVDTAPLNGAQITSAVQVVQEVSRGTLAMSAGRELLMALGISPDRVERMLSEKPPVAPDIPNQAPAPPAQDQATPDAPPDKKQAIESAVEPFTQAYIAKAFAAFDAMIEDGQ